MRTTFAVEGPALFPYRLVQQPCQPQSRKRQLFIHNMNIPAIIVFVNRGTFIDPNLTRNMERLVGPLLRRTSHTPIEVLFHNHLFQEAGVFAFGMVGMLNQADVPRPVKITGPRSALCRTELHDVNIVPALRFGNGMERLMHIGHEVHKEFQSFDPFGGRCASICEHAVKHRDAINNAIVVIGQRRRISVARVIAVALFVKPVSVPGNIHEVPAESFPPVAANLVGPCGNRGKIVIPQKLYDRATSACAQVIPCNIGDHAMT